MLYQRHGIVLIAVHESTWPEEPTINPGQNYVFQGREIAYVISPNRTIPALIEKEEEIVITSNDNYAIEMVPLEMSESFQYSIPSSNLNLIESLSSFNEELGEWESFLEDTYDEPIPQNECEEFNLEDLQNHVIICGNVSNLGSFISSLRLKHNNFSPDILIIHPTDIPRDQWRIIGRFQRIYLLKICPYTGNIFQCNLDKAKSFVILHSPNNVNQNGIMTDTQTILLHRELKANFPKLQIISELKHTEDVRFIKPGWGSEYERHHSLSGVSNVSVSGRLLHPEYHYHPYFASGSVFTPSTADSLLCHLLTSPNLISLVRLLCNRGNSVKHAMRSSSVQLIELPIELNESSYEKVFEYFIRRDIICIGLYRGADYGGNSEPFVFTNPDKSTIITSDDSIFVLSKK